MDTLKNESTLTPLNEFISDFVDNNLAPFEKEICQQYFDQNPAVFSFVSKSMKGKQMLNHAFVVKSADDFEEKLAKRIAVLKKNQEA